MSTVTTSPSSNPAAQKQDANKQVRVNFLLDMDEHTRLKIYAAKNRSSIADILRQLVSTLDA